MIGSAWACSLCAERFWYSGEDPLLFELRVGLHRVVHLFFGFGHGLSSN